MYDTEELAMTIRDELDPAQSRCARLFELLGDIEMALNNSDVRLGECQPEIELGLELAKELACAMRRGLTDVELTCARALGEDDMDMAA
jgi:hypothetical protein